MTNTRLDRTNGQRGSALILVLIALTIGAMLITPTLNYVYAGLGEIPIGEKQLFDQYTADAAMEYGLWQLVNNVDNITGQLSPANPSDNSSITINGTEVTLTTEISMSPESDDGSFEMPPTQSGIHIAVGLEVLAPRWTKAGNKAYLTHVIYIYNYGTSATHLKALFQQLDPRLTFVQNSYDGPKASFAKTLVDDHWELRWLFDQPLPKLNSQDWIIVTFVTTTKEDWGEQTYSGDGWVEYAAFHEDQVEAYSGESGPASFGLYDLSVTVGSYNLMVNVGITETGEVVIRSWQVE